MEQNTNKSRRVPKVRTRSKSEMLIMRECINWFKSEYPRIYNDGMLFHIPNEGIRNASGEDTTNSSVTNGVIRGVADVCLSVPKNGYGALYIEMKKSNTYAKPYQEKWGRKCASYGNKYVVCHSLNEFITAIKCYLS